MKKTGIEKVDSRGRINLAQYVDKEDRVFIMERHKDGRIVLTPAAVIPKSERTDTDLHGGFHWGQKVRIKAVTPGDLRSREGRIDGFQLGNPHVARVRIADQFGNVSVSYNVSDLEAL